MTLEPHLDQGEDAYNNQDIEGAIAAYSAAIAENPDDARPHVRRGQIYLINGDCKRALPDFQRALKLDGELVDAWYGLADAYRCLDRVEESIAAYGQVIAREPRYGLAYLARAIVYGVNDQPANALADAHRAIELLPDDSDAYFVRGWVYGNSNDPARALADFGRAVELEPAHTHAYAEAANLLLEQQPEQALAAVNRAIELDPEFAFAYYVRANVYKALGNESRARSDARKARSLEKS
jgi:tetratricopeptide (TPR) repeat protein